MTDSPWTLEQHYEDGGKYYSGLENLKNDLEDNEVFMCLFVRKEQERSHTCSTVKQTNPDFSGDKRMEAIYHFFKKEFEKKVKESDNDSERKEIYKKIYKQNQDVYRHNIWKKAGVPPSRTCRESETSAKAGCIAKNQKDFISKSKSAEEKKAKSEKIRQKNLEKIECRKMGPNHTWVEADSDDQKEDGFLYGVCKIKNNEGTPLEVTGTSIGISNGGRKKKRKSRRRKTKNRRKTKRKSRRRKSRKTKRRRRRRRKSRR